MAKKDKEEKETVGSFSDRVSAELNKQFKSQISTSAEPVLKRKQQVVNWSPAFDIGLGGGVPGGVWISASGPEKCGKTTSLLTLAAKFQKVDRHIYFMNVEARIKSRDLLGIKGLSLDPQHFTLIESKKDKMLSSLDYLNAGELILKTHPGCVLLIDSMSALASQKQLDEGVGVEQRGRGNQLVSQFCDNMAGVVNVNDCIVMGVTHLYANTGGGHAKWNEKAAKRWLYQADIRLAATHFKFIINKGRTVGQQTFWYCKTSAIGPPNIKFSSYLRYGIGLDEVYEIMEFALMVGLIHQKGAWYTLSDGQCFQGKENLYEGLLTVPLIVEELRLKVMSMADALVVSEEEKEE